MARLDCCLLRPTWSLGWGYGEGFDALGPATVATATATGALRGILEGVAAPRGGDRMAKANARTRRTRGGDRYLHAQIPLYHGRDASPFVAVANRALLGAREWAAEAAWAMYGGPDDTVRYYTLTVAYKPPIGEAPSTGSQPPEVRLWGVALGRVEEVDAVLHTYIRGWSRCTSLRVGTPRDAQEELALRDSTVAR